jgi:DNA-binding CsgD family transcriptional regulator
VSSAARVVKRSPQPSPDRLDGAVDKTHARALAGDHHGVLASTEDLDSLSDPAHIRLRVTAAAANGSYAVFADALQYLIRSAIRRKSVDELCEGAVWAALVSELSPDPGAFVELLLEGRAALDVDRPELDAAIARLSARQPFLIDRPVMNEADDRSVATPALSWTVESVTSTVWADDARTRADRKDERASLFVDAAWRSVHRDPLLLAERRAVSSARLSNRLSGDRSSRHIETDMLFWHAVDALEGGDLAGYEAASRRIRAETMVDGLAHHRWWAATSGVMSLVLNGEFAAARKRALMAFEMGRSAVPSGAFPVMLFQTWQLDDLNDSLESIVAIALADRSVIDHPVAALVGGLALVRSGHIDEAVRRASWTGRWITSQTDRETNWTAMMVMAADLAAELVTIGHPYGDDLAEIVLPQVAAIRHLVAVDGRGVVCLGPVARAEAALLLARGDLDAALASHHVATGLVERLARPLVHTAEIALQRIHLDRLAGISDPSALSALLRMTENGGLSRLHRHAQQLAVAAPTADDDTNVLTERQAEVLRLIGQGQSNREIAVRLGFSVSTIAKETMRIYRKLGLADRSTAIELVRDARPLVLVTDERPAGAPNAVRHQPTNPIAASSATLAGTTTAS